MNGLLDDPNRAGLLAMGLGLLSSRGNFANALGQAGFQGLQAMQSTQDRLALNKRNELQDTILRRQMEDAERKRMIEEARRTAMRGAFTAEKPATMDDRDVGQPGEAPVPMAFDLRRYATNLAQAGDPAAVPMLEQLNQRRTQVLPTGQVVEFMPDGSVRELYKPAEKAPAPTREQLNFQAAQNNPAFMDFLRPQKPVAAAPAPRASAGPAASAAPAPDGADPLANLSAQDQAIVRGIANGSVRPADLPTKGNYRARMVAAASTLPQARPAPQLSIAEKNMVEEADGLASASRSAAGILSEALELNRKAYSGVGAQTRAAIASNVANVFGAASPRADATVDLNNMILEQALGSLKAIFGAAPTEGERKILIDLQASVDKTPAQREAILNRALEAARRREESNRRKAEQIRSGTYFRPQEEREPAAPAGRVVDFNSLR